MRKGGKSDPRNKTLMKMFNLVNIGERSGSGVPNIFNTWEDQGWKEPVIEERFDPDRTILTLEFVDKTNKEKTAKKSGEEKTAKKKITNKTKEKNDKNKSCLDLAATEIYLRFRARRFSMEMSASISSSSSCFIRSVALSIRGRLCSSESKNC